jgi:hypothetical protein
VTDPPETLYTSVSGKSAKFVSEATPSETLNSLSAFAAIASSKASTSIGAPSKDRAPACAALELRVNWTVMFDLSSCGVPLESIKSVQSGVP